MLRHTLLKVSHTDTHTQNGVKDHSYLVIKRAGRINEHMTLVMAGTMTRSFLGVDIVM